MARGTEFWHRYCYRNVEGPDGPKEAQMRKCESIFLLSVLVLFTFPALAQDADKNVIWPGWGWGIEEYVFQTLPVGGWNTLGTFSSKSTAMGETLFSSLNSSSGYLNPSFLAVLDKPVLSFDYRFIKNTYKTSYQSPIIPLIYPYYPTSETYSYSRNTDSIDYFGVALPFKGWTVAANYFLFQEYNFPGINGPSVVWYSWLDQLKQSGDMKGVNLAVAYRFSPSFSAGISASYLFGDISRFQSYQPIYYIMERYAAGGDSVPLDIAPESWPWPSVSEEYQIDLDGMFFDLGFTFQPNDNWALGFSLRPPFALNLNVQVDTTYADFAIPEEPLQTSVHTSGKYYSKQPLVATVSTFYTPVKAMTLTMDLSYWAWSSVSTNYYANWDYYYRGWYYPLEFKNIFKLNLGAEYRIKLPFEEISYLSVRAGYIYDPQPYPNGEGSARNSLCAGFGVDVGPFEIEFAAKLAVGAKELQRFSSNALQVGITYHSK